eukprot:Em0065g9a
MDGQNVQKSPFDLDVITKYSTLCNPGQVIYCSNGPSGIAIHDSGDIYCTQSRICVIDQSGKHKRTIGSSGSGDGQFRGPHGIFIKRDVMYVADVGNDRIQKLTIGGEVIQKYGQRGSGQGQFNGPIAVIVDQRDRLIVADHLNHRVVLLDQAGTWLLTIKGNVSGPQNIENPYGLALDSQGNIHVAARGSSTIKFFSPEGTYNQRYILPLDRWTVAYVKISMTVLNNLEYDKYISVDRTDSNCSYDEHEPIDSALHYSEAEEEQSYHLWKIQRSYYFYQDSYTHKTSYLWHYCSIQWDSAGIPSDASQTTPNDVRNSEQLQSITPVDEFDISVNPGSRDLVLHRTTYCSYPLSFLSESYQDNLSLKPIDSSALSSVDMYSSCNTAPSRSLCSGVKVVDAKQVALRI